MKKRRLSPTLTPPGYKAAASDSKRRNSRSKKRVKTSHEELPATPTTTSATRAITPAPEYSVKNTRMPKKTPKPRSSMKKPPKKMEAKQRESKHSPRLRATGTRHQGRADPADHVYYGGSSRKYNRSDDDDDDEEEEEEEEQQYAKPKTYWRRHVKPDDDVNSSDHYGDDDDDDDDDEGDDDASSDGEDDGNEQSKVASFLTSTHNLIHNALKLVILLCIVVCGVILYHDYTSKQAGPSIFCRTGHPGPPFEIPALPALPALSDGQHHRAITDGPSGGTAQSGGGPSMVECLPCPPHATCQDYDRRPTCHTPTHVLDASGRACISDVGLARSADNLLKQALHLAQVQKGDSRCGRLDSNLKPLQSRVQEEAMRAKLSKSFAAVGDLSFEDVYTALKQRIRQENLGLILSDGAYESERMVQTLQCRVQEVFKAHFWLIIKIFFALCGLVYIYSKFRSYFRKKQQVKVLTKKVLECLKQRAKHSEEHGDANDISLRMLKGRFAKRKSDRAVWEQVVRAVRKTSFVHTEFFTDKRTGRKREYFWAIVNTQ